MKKQTAGRNHLGNLAPKFAELNDDVLFGEVWSRKKASYMGPAYISPERSKRVLFLNRHMKWEKRSDKEGKKT